MARAVRGWAMKRSRWPTAARVPRPPGVQDSASQFVELGHRFATGKDVLEVGRSVSYWMARPGGVDLWTYDIVGKEMLQSPAAWDRSRPST